MHGGLRSGAGRPRGSIAPHTIQAQEFRVALIEEVRKAQGPIIKALVDQAKKGNVTALKEVLDRVLGRAFVDEPDSHSTQPPFTVIIR